MCSLIHPLAETFTDLGGQMQAGMESCLTKSIMAGGMGFALGGAFGLFMSSVRLRLSFFFFPRSFVKYGWATISTALLERPFLSPLSRFMGRGSTNVVGHSHRCR